MIFNVLNFPAGVVRMTKVTSQDQEKLKDYPIRDKFHGLAKQVIHKGEPCILHSNLRYCYSCGYVVIDRVLDLDYINVLVEHMQAI